MALGFTSTKTMPLISFHAIVDEDLALLAHVATRYRESKVFDLSKLKEFKSTNELIGVLYRRKFENPLNLILSGNQYQDLADRAYKEFIDEHEAEILEHVALTGVYDLIQEFKKSGEINPSILYYTDAQFEFLKTLQPLDNIPKVSLQQALKNPFYSHFYFKFIHESYPFEDKVIESVFYVSTIGRNLTEENDVNLDNEKIMKLMYRRTRYAIFDLYNMQLIGDYKNENGKSWHWTFSKN